jgi:Holliday junction resolvase-like predicted endonuclease
MEKIYQHKEIESLDQKCILTQLTAQVDDILSLKDFEWHQREFDLRRGEQVIVREIKVTAEIVEERCFKHGFNGAKRAIVKSKTQKVLSEKQYKLWRTKKRGWYWTEK